MSMPNSPLKYIPHRCEPGVDLGFEKGGGAGDSGARPQDLFGQFREFLKNLAQKGVGVRPPPSPCARPLDPRP